MESDGRKMFSLLVPTDHECSHFSIYEGLPVFSANKLAYFSKTQFKFTFFVAAAELTM